MVGEVIAPSLSWVGVSIMKGRAEAAPHILRMRSIYPRSGGAFFGAPQISLRRMLMGECFRMRNPTFNVRSLR